MINLAAAWPKLRDELVTEPRGSGLSDGFILALLTALGTLLRFYRLGSQSLWIDELATMEISSLPLREIVAVNVSNNSFEPPLYFWLIHGVVGLLGSSEYAIRLPSAVAGSLTIPMLWLLVRATTGQRNTARLSAALLAVHPLHLWYSQEARPYAILALSVCIGLYGLARFFRTGSRGGALVFTVFGVLAVFTHLTGIVMLAAAWGWAAARGRGRQVVTSLLGASALILASVAPLLFFIAKGTAQNPGTGSPPRSLTGLEIPYTLLTYVTGYSFGPSLRDIQNHGPVAALAAHPIESVIAVLMAAGSLIVIMKHYQSNAAAFMTLLGSFVGLMFLASALTGKAYSVRYTLPGLIGFVGLLAIALCWSRRRALLMSLLLVMFVWGDIQWLFSPEYEKDNSRAVVQWLSRHLPPGSRVAVGPGYATKILSYYAAKEKAQLEIEPLVAPETWRRKPPSALVLTRLHHVTDHAGIVAAYTALVGGRVFSHHGVGYDVYYPRMAEE